MNIIKKLKVFYRFHLKKSPSCGPISEKDMNPQKIKEFDFKLFKNKLKKKSDDFHIQLLHEVEYKREIYQVFYVKKKKVETEARKILILSGKHGNEQAGVYAMPKILKVIEESEADVRIITPINPVGLLEFSRYNK